jgi:hypothetical protein
MLLRVESRGTGIEGATGIQQKTSHLRLEGATVIGVKQSFRYNYRSID